ncbi:MAG: hypothetical protein H0W99_15865 [Acidobacteria bacterium]|nr:hypothetical protein [Acidobacteriota bacterium]
MFVDVMPFDNDFRKFKRTFSIEHNANASSLVGCDEASEWSLLSLPGPFIFIGEEHFVELSGLRYSLPRRWQSLYCWTGGFVYSAITDLKRNALRHKSEVERERLEWLIETNEWRLATNQQADGEILTSHQQETLRAIIKQQREKLLNIKNL